MSKDLGNFGNIQHIVLLMLENRSFDHMLGFLYRESNNLSPLGHKFDGLSGSETNPDGHGHNVTVKAIAPNDPRCYFYPNADPGEGYFNTNSQLFGKHIVGDQPGNASMQGFVTNFAYSLGWEGREHWSILPGTKPEDIMAVHSPKTLPVLSGLAKGYAVCDRWFCSVPTETLPNRAFALMATSQGRLSDKDKVYTARSIFRNLSDHGHSWSVYGYDKAPLTRHSVADITNAPNEYFGEYKDFQAACKSGKLANFTFLEPSWGTKGNSQHPNYDVSKGEEFIYDVYQTLRNSPIFDKTLLVITYDEHGGCYDHVAPPSNALAPDESASEHDFRFDRFGPRVPAVLVSPYIQAGSVYRSSGQTPFDHTSVLSTVAKRFSLPFLTKRDQAAPDLCSVITLDKARSDDPLSGIKPPSHSNSFDLGNKPTHLDEVHADYLAQLPLSDEDGNGYHHHRPHFETERDIHRYIKDRSESFHRWHGQHYRGRHYGRHDQHHHGR
jgi:phospholipase C